MRRPSLSDDKEREEDWGNVKYGNYIWLVRISFVAFAI